MRWDANIALFIGAEVAYVGLFAAIVRAAPSIALTMLAFVVVFTLPFLPLYLTVLAHLPKRWTHGQRRAAAIGASPLVLAFFVVLAIAASSTAALLLIALPGAMAYGALVRMPTTSDDQRHIPISQRTSDPTS